MDNFTLAVVIGIGIVVCVFVGLIAVDKGPPASDAALPKARKKKSA